MDEFLRIVGMNHIENSGTFEIERPEILEFLEELKKHTGTQHYEELSEILDDAVLRTIYYSFTEGMKVAIEIIEKKYVPNL